VVAGGRAPILPPTEGLPPDFVLDVTTCRYYMRDPSTDNGLIDYYTVIFSFVTC